MEAGLVHDPVQNYRLRFSQEGEVLRIEMWVDPGGGVGVEHYHPQTEERFEVLEGEITFRVDGQKLTARAGEKAVAPAGSRHTFQNTGSVVAHALVQAEPAFDLQQYLEEAAALARAGKYTRRGIPKGIGALLELSDFTERYRHSVVVTSPPLALQRILMPPLARLERRRRSKRAKR